MTKSLQKLEISQPIFRKIDSDLSIATTEDIGITNVCNDISLIRIDPNMESEDLWTHEFTEISIANLIGTEMATTTIRLKQKGIIFRANLSHVLTAMTTASGIKMNNGIKKFINCDEYCEDIQIIPF